MLACTPGGDWRDVHSASCETVLKTRELVTFPTPPRPLPLSRFSPAQGVVPGRVRCWRARRTVACPRRVERYAVVTLEALVRWIRVVVLRSVLAATLVGLVGVLHHELILLAGALEVTTAEPAAGVMVAQPVATHARVLVLADPAAHGAARIALPHRP